MTARSITQIPATFSYQSYFADADLAGAILKQSPGDAVVASTLRQAQTPGIGVALHPLSESPVAIRFKGGSADSAAVVLTPGQTLRVGSFQTFEWGLPFGWLGGGSVLLYVLHDQGSDVSFGQAGGSPTIFQRARYVIEAAPFPGASRLNWPGTFPWPSAARKPAPAQPQGGATILAPEMDMALFRLRSSIVAPATLSLVWRGVDALDLDGTDTLVTTDYSTYELTFSAVPAGSGTFPVAWLPPEIHRLTAAAGGVNLIDTSGALTGAFCDVVRYAKLG